MGGNAESVQVRLFFLSLVVFSLLILIPSFSIPAGSTIYTNDSIYLDKSSAKVILSDPITGNSSYTNQTTANLTLDFTEMVGDPINCSLKDESGTWSSWSACPSTPDPLRPTIIWPLSASDGMKTVHLKVNTSFRAIKESNASILFDTTPPSGSIKIWAIDVPGVQGANSNATAYTTVTLRTTFSDSVGLRGCAYANDIIGDPEGGPGPFGPIQDCESIKTWILNGEDGVRTVHYRIFDLAGNVYSDSASIILDKSGAELDTTPPSIAPVVYDISEYSDPLGHYTSRDDILYASWTAGYDPDSERFNLPLTYNYSIGTTPDATDIVDWTSVGTALEMTHTGLTLSDGVTYYINVRAINAVGLYNGSSSDGITVDTVEPVISSLWSNTHNRSEWNKISNTPHFIWTGSDTISGIYGYSYIISDDPSAVPDNIPEGELGNFAGETSTYFTNLIDGKLYFHIKARDNAGNWGMVETFELWIDRSPPTIPFITAPEIIPNMTNMTYQWTQSSDPHSGILGYRFRLYNSSVHGVDTLVHDEFLVGHNQTSLTLVGLPSGIAYHAAVTALNGAGIASGISRSISEFDNEGPIIIIETPGYDYDSGEICYVMDRSPILRVKTDETATCRYRADAQSAYEHELSYTGSLYHETRMAFADTGAKNISVRCWDAIGNEAELIRPFDINILKPGLAELIFNPSYVTGTRIEFQVRLAEAYGGMNPNELVVVLDGIALDDDKFGVTDLGCGDYLITLEDSLDPGNYTIEALYAGTSIGPRDMQVSDLKLTVAYSSSFMSSGSELDRLAYGIIDGIAVGVATEGVRTEPSASAGTVNVRLSPSEGSVYLFASGSASSLRSVDRTLRSGSFTDSINPNFGTDLRALRHDTIMILGYEDYLLTGIDELAPGRYTFLVQNYGYDEKGMKNIIKIDARR